MIETTTIVCNFFDMLIGVTAVAVSTVALLKEEDKFYQKVISIFLFAFVIYTIFSFLELLSNLWERFI